MVAGSDSFNSDNLSKIYLTAASTAGLPREAICLLVATAVEKSIEAVFFVNGLTPPNRDQALFLFTERFVLNGGFPRGIEKEISVLYKMRDGLEPVVEDGGLLIAKSILRELHRTVKAWQKEKQSN